MAGGTDGISEEQFGRFINSSLSIDDLAIVAQLLREHLRHSVEAIALTQSAFAEQLLRSGDVREDYPDPLSTTYALQVNDFRFLLQRYNFVMLNTSELQLLMMIVFGMASPATSNSTSPTSVSSTASTSHRPRSSSAESDAPSSGYELTVQSLIHFVGEDVFRDDPQQRTQGDAPRSEKLPFPEPKSDEHRRASRSAPQPSAGPQHDPPPRSLPPKTTIAHLSYLLAQTERSIASLAEQISSAADAHDNVVEQFEALRHLCQRELGVRAQRWGELAPIDDDSSPQPVLPHTGERPGTAPAAQFNVQSPSSRNAEVSASASGPNSPFYRIVEEPESGVSFIDAATPPSLYDSYQSPRKSSSSSSFDSPRIRRVSPQSQSDRQHNGHSVSANIRRSSSGADVKFIRGSGLSIGESSENWQHESTIDFDTSAPTPQASRLARRGQRNAGSAQVDSEANLDPRNFTTQRRAKFNPELPPLSEHLSDADSSAKQSSSGAHPREMSISVLERDDGVQRHGHHSLGWSADNEDDSVDKGVVVTYKVIDDGNSEKLEQNSASTVRLGVLLGC